MAENNSLTQRQDQRAEVLSLQHSSCRGDPNHKLISLLLHNCTFATAMSQNVTLMIGSFDPHRGCDPQAEKHCRCGLGSEK